MPSSEPIWYYAQDDREHGPVTAAYIAGMARTGKLRPEDLVWREGMEDWRPARAIRGLFGAQDRPAGVASDTADLDSPFDAHPPSNAAGARAPQQAEASQTVPALAPEGADGEDGAGAQPLAPQPAPPPVAANRFRSDAAEFEAGEPMAAEVDDFSAPLIGGAAELRLSDDVFQRTGRILLVVGLLLALLSKGCDLAAERSVARMNAKAQMAQDRAQLAAAADPASGPSPIAETARSLEAAARAAHWTNQSWAFWRAILLLIGMVLFATGVLPLAVAGAGADRWLGIALFAALALAIFSQ